MIISCCHFFFFNDTATTEIYTLSLHDALPICMRRILEGEALFNDASGLVCMRFAVAAALTGSFGLSQALLDFLWVASGGLGDPQDRKSTRLNSSHSQISYAVFCLKKKK